MEKGARALVWMLAGAFALGLLVTLLNPLYRQAALGLLRGDRTSSPLWLSNANYYDAVSLPAGGQGEDAE